MKLVQACAHDPEKRDLIVKEFLELKKRLQNRDIERRTGERELQTDLSKIFKSITDVQKSTAEDIRSDTSPIKENLSELKKITFPAFPSIEGFQQQEKEDTDTQFIGPIAQEYLRKFASKSEADRTYGLYDKNGNFYIGNKPVAFVDDNIVVDGEEYQGTPGLWELIVTKNPDDQIYTDQDYENYAKMMIESTALKKGNDPESNRPEASKGLKWKNVLRTIWTNRDYYEGTGTSVVIPSDPNELLERLDLLMASKAAAKNHGFRRQYVYGGAGMFDSIASFFTRLFTSNAAKQIASTALDAGKSVAKEVGKKAMDAGKTAALDAGKNFLEKGVRGLARKALTPKSRAILQRRSSHPQLIRISIH
ncbi:uncharacterized protein LOC132564146 [Ylistrum balloti]|uniref:uncharacterized protein LOC132564146 n=1 Tax=Ylistrum balloti TaxID=509963 RepID=UPI002905F19E|nr:uncharacterized protein LOC132564146 [Ylistrum balloti]